MSNITAPYIPTMFSDSTPSPFIASASNTHPSDGVGYAYGVFDGNSSTFWHTNYPITINESNPVWIKIKLDKTIKIWKYSLTSRQGWADGCRDFKIQGSNDDSIWIDIDTRSGINWNAGQTQEFIINTVGAKYLYYRLLITNFTRNGSTANFASLAEFKIYEASTGYKTSGNAISSGYSLSYATQISSSCISWTESKTSNNTLTVQCGLSSSSSIQPATWQDCTNGSSLPCFQTGGNYTNQYLWFKILMSTTNSEETPTLSNLQVQYSNGSDANKIALIINPLTRMRKPEGNVTVQYTQSSGTLQGEGGYVENFTKTFLPTGLTPIPNPYERENISVGLSDMIIAPQIVTYKDGYETEQISAGISDLAIVCTFVGTVNP